MNSPRPKPHVIVFLSAPPGFAKPQLVEILAQRVDQRITIYLRESDRAHYEEHLAGCFAVADKPAAGKRAFVQDLRSHHYDEAVVLDEGGWEFHQSRCLFFLARADRRTVHTERGVFELSLLRPGALARHLLYRAKNRRGSVANMPPGTPLPFLFAGYRKTLGLALGVLRSAVEYGWRRIRP